MTENADTVTRKGACPVCGIECHILAHIKDGKVVKVEKDTGSLMGNVCLRGGCAVDYHYHPKRLNHALRRVGARGEGKWEHISWEQAMDEIAAKLAGIRDRYGPEAVGALGGYTHDPADAAAWKWCNLWGTPNFFHLGKNCGEAEYPVECAMYGYDTTQSWATFLDPNKTKVLILWGSNLSVSIPPLWEIYKFSQSGGMKIVVVDPKPTECALASDLWLQLRPGTDGALALGMLNVIINENLYDHEFVEKWCLGFDEVKALAQQYPPDKASEITRVPEEKIIKAARMYAEASAAVLTWGVAGAGLGPGAGLSSALGKCWLRAVTGNLDREGGQVFTMPPYHTAFMEELDWDHLINHPLRTRDNVSADVRAIGSVRALSLFKEGMKRVYPKGWGAQQYFVYPMPYSFWEAILTGKPYPIKAVITMATNPLLSMGGAKHVYDAFKSDNLELHVVMEHFLTPTAAMADYVLPATDALERPNYANNWGMRGEEYGRLAAIEPEGERHDVYQLWRGLGTRLGQAEYWPDTLEHWLDKLLAPLGMTLRQLADSWGYQPKREFQRYRSQGFGTFSGKVELIPSLLEKLGYDKRQFRYQESPWSPVSNPEMAKEYPLILISGGRVKEFCTSRHRQIRHLRKLHPDPLMEIHPDTAHKLGISDGDWAWIETPVGRVRQRARLLEGIAPDVVHAEYGWWFPEREEAHPTFFGTWESNINAIIPDSPELCDYAGNSYFRGLLCRVYKAT